MDTFAQVGQPLTLGYGENMITTGAIDVSNGFLYYGTYTRPGRIAKISVDTFTETAVLTLNNGKEE